MSAEMFVVAGGKGGVGKTFITVSSGITASKIGKKVLMVDLDPSGGNVHTSLGLEPSSNGIEKFWFEAAQLKSLVRKTEIPRLSIIQGLLHHWVPPVLTKESAQDLMRQLKALDFDMVLVDVGPCNSEFQLELLSQADQALIVTTPEPAAIEKTYRLFESFLSHHWSKGESKTLYRLVNESLSKYRKNLAALEIGFHDYVVRDFPELANGSKSSLPKLSLIVNCARCPEDQTLGHSIRSVAKKHFNLDFKYLGAVEHDNAVWQTMRAFQMVLIDKPLSPITAQLMTIVRSLVEPKMDASLERAVI